MSDFAALLIVVPVVVILLGLSLIPLWERDMRDIEKQIEEAVKRENEAK
jgi:hypothetical protein